MGNSSRKMKKKLNTWYYSNKNGSVKIGSHMTCPKCDRYFSPNTTYNAFNSHLDSCLTAHDFNNASADRSDSMSDVSVSQIDAAEGSGSVAENTKFVWVKKIGSDNEPTWEKVPMKMVAAENNLRNMNEDEAEGLNFEDKQRWFKIQNNRKRIPWISGADYLYVSEKNLLESASKSIKKVNLHKEVKVVFEEEKRINDAGGLMREFIHLASVEIFSAEKGLFIKADTQEVIYKINPKAPDTLENLEMFRMVGQVIGKAIFEQITIPSQIDRLLLKQITQKEFTLEDLLTLDKPLYNSLKYIRETKIDGSDVFEEYFTIPSPVDATPMDLVPGGSTIRITDDNKEEYIKLILEALGYKCVENKVDAFLMGLDEVIPSNILKPFTVEQLEMILNGLPFIDLNDWEANTIYKGSYYKNHQIIKWFWEIMRELEQPQLVKFFHFCTGSSRPPVEGFRALQSNRGEFQKFTIESLKQHKGLIRAHTCFNRLELPMFSKKEALRENIHEVLKADFMGVFGIE